MTETFKSALRAVRSGWSNGHPVCRLWLLFWVGLPTGMHIGAGSYAWAALCGVAFMFFAATMPSRETVERIIRRRQGMSP